MYRLTSRPSIASKLMLFLAWIAIMLGMCPADATSANLRNSFGAGIYEMPAYINVPTKENILECSSFHGAMMLTPKALRFYVFKPEDSESANVTASTNETTRTIIIARPKCRYVIKIQRFESSVPLVPANGSGVPGSENEQVGSSRIDDHVSAFFPDTASNCGLIIMSIQGGPSGISWITSAINGITITTKPVNQSQKPIILSKDRCETSMMVGVETAVGTAWKSVELR